MKRVFISQPMNGKSDEEIVFERSKAMAKVQRLADDDIEVIDTFYDDFGPEAKPLEYLARSIADLAKADIAYFVKGWDKARGCRIEHECATQYGIECISED